MTRKPHIVIFNPDQFRADALGHLGNTASRTPNLDRICREDGVSFRNAFCQNPVCTPSRCSYMSGWYPHVRGHRTMHYMMSDDEPVLLRTLKESGYFVWWGGKNDLLPAGKTDERYYSVRYRAEAAGRGSPKAPAGWRGPRGGDNFYSFYIGKLDPNEEGGYVDNDWRWINGAVDFIGNAPANQPVCIYLPIVFPHPPYGVEEPWYGMINRADVPPRIPTPPGWEGKPSMLAGLYELQNMRNWSEPRWTELRATYLGMCSRVDHQFGIVVEALKAKGMYDDTAIFAFSDHGDYTGDYGIVEKTQNTFEDALTRVPFLIKPPAWVPVAPGIRDALVELVDFPATVEALAGLTPRHTHFGRSLLPLVRGETDSHRNAVFCEGGRLQGERHCMELSSGYHGEPDGLYWPRLHLHRSEGPEHGKAVMVRTMKHKYVRRHYEKDELYDLTDDPMELCNRIDDPSLGCVLSSLKEELLTFYLGTCDIVPQTTDKRESDP